jgi:hypothetical protein
MPQDGVRALRGFEAEPADGPATRQESLAPFPDTADAAPEASGGQALFYLVMLVGSASVIIYLLFRIMEWWL